MAPLDPDFSRCRCRRRCRIVGSLLPRDTPMGAIHSTKISGNFGPKLNGSVRSNLKSFEKTGPPFEVFLFFRSDRSEFWSNGSRPKVLVFYRKSFSFTENWARGRALLFLIWIVPKSQCQGLILQMPDKIITIFLLMFLLFLGSVLTPRYTCRNTSLPS